MREFQTSTMSDAQRAEFERLIGQFEDAWFTGGKPAIDAFLPADAALRPFVLAELVQIELELCRKAGETVSAEIYLARFPELAADLRLVECLRLALAEHLPPAQFAIQAGRARVSEIEQAATLRAAGVFDSAPASLANDKCADSMSTVFPSQTYRPSATHQRPTLIGDYEIIELIASGGMGVVYRARHRLLGREAAVKMILAGHLACAEEIRRFLIEAEAAAQLDHPGIVPIFEVGEQHGQYYLALAYVDGRSLWDLVKESPLEAHDAARLMEQVANAIQHAHQNGIVHRDLKPQNILITRDRQARVTDFGLAKRQTQDSNLTRTGQPVGTPSYMAPEQAKGQIEKVGPSSDIYALGATLYCTLTGHPPFQAANVWETMRQVLEDEPVPPKLVNPDVPADLQGICLKCLSKRQEDRYVSCSELAADLRRFLDGERPEASDSGWMTALMRKLQRSRDDAELHSWGTMLWYFALIVWLAEVGIFLNDRHGPPYPISSAVMIRISQFAAMAFIFFIYRAAWQKTAQGPAEQLWSLWIAFIVACHIVFISGIQLQTIIAPERPVEFHLCYPCFAALSGMLFIALGRNFWGYCYAFGCLFFILALIMPHCLPWAPLLFGTVWALLLSTLGARLRRMC